MNVTQVILCVPSKTRRRSHEMEHEQQYLVRQIQADKNGWVCISNVRDYDPATGKIVVICDRGHQQEKNLFQLQWYTFCPECVGREETRRRNIDVRMEMHNYQHPAPWWKQ